MPSTPRLRTPAFSTTNSPMAAKTSGVAAMMMPSAILTTRSIKAPSPGRLLRGSAPHGTALKGNPPQAIVDEHVRRQQKEQQHTLEDARDRAWQVHGNLSCFAANVGEGEQQATDQDSERMKASQKRDDDGGEAIADGQGRDDLTDGTGRLEHARQPRQAA